MTACLPWFDEPVKQLYDTVRSAAVIADKVVALDGGYVNYPGARPRSRPEQHRAIERAAQDAGLKLRIETPGRIWAGQVEKRDALVKLAEKWGADWLVGLDADYVLWGDRKETRAQLAAQPPEVCALTVDFGTPIPEGANLDDVAAGEWHRDLAGRVIRLPLVFRCLKGMRVERRHWWYSGVRGGERVALWGCEHLYPPVVTKPLEADFYVEHLCLYRRPRNVLGNRAFCDARVPILAQTGQEDALEVPR